MSGAAGLFQFLVNIIGLAIVIGLIFAAMEFRPLPDPFKKFARLAVGGAGALAALIIIGAVFGWVGASAIHVTIAGIFEFAIGVLVLYGVLYVVDFVLAYFKVPFAEQISFVLSVIALIVILTLAATALTSGGLGFITGLGQGLSVQRQPVR